MIDDSPFRIYKYKSELKWYRFFMAIFQQDIDKFLERCDNFLAASNLEEIKEKIKSIQNQLSEPDIWDNHQKATKLNKELSQLQKNQEKYEKLQSMREELFIAGEINEEELVEKTYKQANEYLSELENLRYLNGKFDDRDALLTVHSGAGGVDAEDWAAELVSMYQAFCKNQAWDCQIINLSSGEEGGIKTATMKIEGEFVYGLLKEEFGVHRLVRLSPFNSAHTRETSFALVEVMPIGIDEEMAIKIEEKDLKWDYFMAGGHGGQSVNTTYSAVRVVHIPTGTMVVCQNERSQVQNKQMALKYLADKLAIIEAEKKQDMKQELRGSWQSAEWGNQIRSYVLHPYKMIKDLRSNWETNNVDTILKEGQILPIIWSVKRANEQKEQS